MNVWLVYWSQIKVFKSQVTQVCTVKKDIVILEEQEYLGDMKVPEYNKVETQIM